MAASSSRSLRRTLRAEASYRVNFYAECDPKPPNLPPFVHHEFKLENLEDGLHFRLYMAGVSKENVKVWIEGGELIAEGIKDKGFEDEDDTSTVTARYNMLVPPAKIFNLDEIKTEIDNGMLKVFVPRRNPYVIDPAEKRTQYYQELK